MKYLVIEIQKFDDSAITTPVFAFDERNSAEAKFHDICAGAARSALPVHACALLTEDGRVVRSECYRHEQEPAPAPETETDVT